MKNIYIILILIFSFTIFSCAKKSDTSSGTTETDTSSSVVSSSQFGMVTFDNAIMQ